MAKHVLKNMPIRGIMLDLARTTEQMGYYQKVIDYAARWGLNTILMHITDNQASAVHFNSHPALASRFAYSRDEMRSLVSFARKRGVTLIPEIESFGHTRYITKAKGYEDLADASDDHPWQFNAVCPVKRKTHQLFHDLYRETAEIFDSSPYIHIGCDEVNFGHSLASRRVLALKPHFVVFGEYVAHLADLVRQTGRQPMMWADHLIHDPRIFRYIDKDIILIDWQYDAPLPKQHIALPAEKGYQVIAGPALMWYKYRYRTPQEAWTVMDEYLRRLAKIPIAQALGMINTLWVPCRHPGGAMWPGIGVFAGRLRGLSLTQAAIEFAEDFWGLTTKTIGEALIQSFETVLPHFKQPNPFWRTPTELADAMGAVEKWTKVEEQVRELVKVFESHRREVKRNREEYDSFVLSIQAQLHGLRRTRTVCEALSSKSKGSNQRAFRQLIGDDRRLMDALKRDWNQTRFADDPLLASGNEELKDTVLLRDIRISAEYLCRLAKSPEQGRDFLPEK